MSDNQRPYRTVLSVIDNLRTERDDLARQLSDAETKAARWKAVAGSLEVHVRQVTMCIEDCCNISGHWAVAGWDKEARAALAAYALVDEE